MSPVPPGRRTLGLVALIIAAVGVLVGAGLLFAGGVQLGTGYAVLGIEPGSVVPSDAPGDVRAIIRTGGFLTLAGWATMVALGAWAAVQGVLALTRNRGRRWAVAAIVVTVLSGAVLMGLFTAGIAVGTG